MTITVIALVLSAAGLAPPLARGDYVENFQEWGATSARTWLAQDLSGAPFNVPANAVVEVAVINSRANAERWGGVRAFGSSLERRFLLHEAEQGGWDVVVMHVQADGSSRIEHYADATGDVRFYLLGYWTSGAYVEKYQSFKAGAGGFWQYHDLDTYGVSADEVAEIVLVNNSDINDRLAGVRANGSSLSRSIRLQEAEGGGDDLGTMFVQADGTASATIGVYAESNTDVDFFLVGYWSTAPGTYTETFSNIGSPSSNATWEDVDLSGYGVSGGDVAEIALGNRSQFTEDTMGVRENGSSLARLLDFHEAEDGGGDWSRMHALADAGSTIEFYHENVIDPHDFLLIGYWELESFVTLTLSDHGFGQESNAFGGSGAETNAELFAFEMDPGADTIAVTQLVFTLSGIAALTDGDWGGIELVVDGNGDGDIGAGESTTAGGSGAVNTAAGTITFSTSFDVSLTTSYILRADFSSLTQCDAVTISLTTDGITTTADTSGETSPAPHAEAGIMASLTGHWKLDDGAGSVAEDSAGGNGGAIIGAGWTDGRLCGALGFDGSGDYVHMGDALDFEDGEDFTITGWFNRGSFNSDDAMVGKRDGVTGGQGYIVYLRGASDSLILEVDDGSDEFTMTSTTTFNSSGWNHFAVVFDESSAANSKIYINGSDDNESQSGTLGDVGSLANALAFRVGADAGGGSPFNGELDDLQVYNRALGGLEIQALAATYKVIDLGTLIEADSLGRSINDSEQIAGYDTDAANGDSSAWLGEACAFTSLGTLAGGSVSEAWGINDSGEIVGWSDNAAGHRKAFFYDGSITDLGTLAGRSDSEAAAVNASSEVAGTALNFGVPPTDRLAFIYLPAPAHTLGAGINGLGTLGGDESVAIDVNDAGQVVGGAEDASGKMWPFLWEAGVMTNLGALGGESELVTHRAQAVNSSGQVAGTSPTAAGASHAFIWESGSMTDLGTLPGGSSSWAFGINDVGKIVGTADVTGGDYHAFIWDGSTMTDLNDLIDPNSTWELIRATDINNDGEIVGWGENPDGDIHAFLLIQSCSTSGPRRSLADSGPFLARASGVTNSNGDFAASALGAQGELLAEIAVTNAPPGEAFTLTVNTRVPGLAIAPRPGAGPLIGSAGGVPRERTMTVESSAPPGSFKLGATLCYSEGDLSSWRVGPEDLELYVLYVPRGTPPGTWVPAGNNIGESETTGVVGDSGFTRDLDGIVRFWAVRDASGVFAVGARAAEQAEETDPGDDDEANVDPGSNEDPAPRRTAGLCGLGMIPGVFVSLAGLTAARSRRRRF